MSELLEAQGITVRFGGLLALDDVTVRVPAGSITGLMGPNGAGKTTLFGVLSGLLRPRSGRVVMDGVDVTRRSPQARARRGLARTFQRIELFGELTVREHLVVAHRAHHRRRRLAADLLGLGTRAGPGEDARVDELLELLGLAPLAAVPASALPLGTGRLVEVGRAAATGARVLLLDEPSSGLDSAETEQLAEVLGRLRAVEGTALLLVEHDIDFVLGLSDRIAVLDFGRLIAEGTPDEVRRDPQVQSAYLGVLGVSPLLSVRDLDVRYGEARAVSGVSFDMEPQEVVAVLGANGAGKSSLAAAIAGVVPVAAGSVAFAGEDVTRWRSHRTSRAGLVYVPEGRGIFPHLSVLDNLRAMLRWSVPRERRAEALERVFAAFPVLGERRRQRAGTLSGGEQQMLSLARVLATEPRLVVADEMSLGLAPLMVDVVFEGLARARAEGVAILLVEQFVERALGFADRAIVLRSGAMVWSGPSAEAGDALAAGYLG